MKVGRSDNKYARNPVLKSVVEGWRKIKKPRALTSEICCLLSLPLVITDGVVNNKTFNDNLSASDVGTYVPC